jgi:MarR family 2-MHQ and catechol resistance regulon transcriptional repressor
MPKSKDLPPATTADLPVEQQVALKLWVTLARAFGAVHDQAIADARDAGLSIGEFAVLELLHHRGQTLLGEIQKRILVSSGGITFLVDKLVEKGLVERRDCPSDRRARYAALTREGARLMRRIFPRHARRITAALQGLSLSQQRDATRLLKQLGLAAAAVAATGGESDAIAPDTAALAEEPPAPASRR